MRKKKKSIYPSLLCGLLLLNSLGMPIVVFANEGYNDQTLTISDISEKQELESQSSSFTPYNLTQLSIRAVASSVYAGEQVSFEVQYQNAVTNEDQIVQNQVLVLHLTGFSKKSLAKIDVEKLKILGITPKLEGNRLIYSLEALKKGETFKTNLSFPTENGLSPSGDKVSVKVEIKNNETGESVFSDSSQTEILSDSTLAVSTKYGETIGASEPIAAPRVGDETKWDFNIHIPKRSSGVKYLKEGEKLKISYRIKGDAVFNKVIGDTPEPTSVSEEGKVIKWEVTNPTIYEQEEATDILLAKEFQLNIRINDDAEVFSKLTGEVLVSAAFIDGTHDSKSYDATVSITRSDKTDPPYLEGSIYGAYWYGPSDGKGTIHTQISDANPTVYQDDLLGWRMYNGVGHALNIYQEPELLELNFDFDGNQEFKQFYAYPAVYKPGLADAQALTVQPIFDLNVTFDDQTSLTLIKNVQLDQMYDFSQTPYKEQLKGKTIQRVTLSYSKIPAGMLNSPGLFFYTKPREGYIGEVTIKPSMRVKGVGNGVGFGAVDFTYTEEGVFDNKKQKFQNQSDAWKKILSKRSAKVVEYGEDAPRVFAQNIEINHNNQLKLGENEVTVTLNNLKNSLAGIKGSFESYVLLPYGLTYLSSGGENYQAEVMTDDYQGTQQTLVKITYQNHNLGINKKISAKFKVQANKKMLSTSRFELYTMIDSTEVISVPESIEETTFDLATSIREDQNDLNNNGNKKEKNYVTTRSTTFSGNHSFAFDLESGFEHVDTQGLLRSNKDTLVNYQIKFNDSSDQSLENLIIIGMLPQVDDYGFVTLEERQSKYALNLTRPIQFKNQAEKFDVYYSKESMIQIAGELDAQSKYADGFELLKNHKNAVSPNWLEETAVQDWAEIRSFKIVQKKGGIIDRQSMLVTLPLKTPKELSAPLEDMTTPATQRAAYMNVSAAANDYMPIENLKTGVFIDPVKGAAVTVRYEDEAGVSIAPEEKLVGNVGETYQTVKKEIEGYTFKSVQGSSKGTFSTTEQMIIYIYKKNQVGGNQGGNKPTGKLPDTGGSTGRLPQTNEAKESVLLIVGMFTLLFVFFIGRKRKKSNK